MMRIFVTINYKVSRKYIFEKCPKFSHMISFVPLYVTVPNIARLDIHFWIIGSLRISDEKIRISKIRNYFLIYAIIVSMSNFICQTRWHVFYFVNTVMVNFFGNNYISDISF